MTRFRPEFTWGVSTSAYQIEGATAEDGRTPSVWDTFCRRDGAIADSSTADVACDHYHRYAEDIALMADLGIDAYRLSTSWSRIIPDDSGKPNAAGLDFYDRLLDSVRDRGITPVVNLFHWDLPQWAQDAGGWRNRDTVERFAEYAAIVADRLADRVGNWAAINELFEHFVLGHVTGEHAPGLTLPLDEAGAVAHHLLLAAGHATEVLRAHGAASIMGINSYAPARPASDAEADVAMARFYDVLQNRLFTDPQLIGRYPEEAEPLVTPFVKDGDLEVISAPLDLWGVNYYSINSVRAVDGEIPLEVVAPQGYPLTAFDWAVAPEGLTETLTTLHTRYGEKLPPLVVSENGCTYHDSLDTEGRCDDPDRVAYLSEHLTAVRAAIDAGVDVRGYYVWSLLDNFEWAQGYTKRFGLVHVDYETQKRTPKTSFNWLRDHIAASR
ncbi:GH1 family beta-glucosidase [Amycolatopsis azurea]|uniref:GH1 family beta-glucosidase n=1 Tax=Amycolatopsis azurea TaxID=36819 RepID=UPI0037F44429